MPASPKIMARVRKLRALSASPNQNEAESARGEAERLMRRHGLTEADFEEDAVEVIDDKCDDLRIRLARAIGASRRVATLANKRGEIAFRGRAPAVKSAADLYRSLIIACAAHCEIGSRDPGRHVWRLCYRQGFVDAVCERLLSDEVQSWMRVARVVMQQRPHAEAVAQPTIEEPPQTIVSVFEEQKAATRDFAGYFCQSDVRRAVEQLTREAYEGGKRFGQSVPIAEWKRDQTGEYPQLEGKTS